MAYEVTVNYSNIISLTFFKLAYEKTIFGFYVIICIIVKVKYINMDN